MTCAVCGEDRDVSAVNSYLFNGTYFLRCGNCQVNQSEPRNLAENLLNYYPSADRIPLRMRMVMTHDGMRYRTVDQLLSGAPVNYGGPIEEVELDE